MPRPRTMIAVPAALAAVLAAACPAAADSARTDPQFEPWPELRFGRELAVRPVTTPVVSLGGLGAGAPLRGRAAWLLRGGLGYDQPLGNSGWSLGFGAFALDTVRLDQSLEVGGHSRLHAAWRRQTWTAAAGIDMWWGPDGMADWAEAASPWAAAAWLGRRGFVGLHGGWDRSDEELGTPAALASFGEARTPGLRAGAGGGGAWGPLHMSLAAVATFDDDNDAELRDFSLAGDVRWPLDFNVGRFTSMLVVRGTPESDAPQPDVSAGLVLRWDLRPRALWNELRGTQTNGDDAAASPAADFDPFGD